MSRIVFMYPGQGSQYFHMAKELYDHHVVFKENMQMIDRMVMEYSGVSVLSSLYDPGNKKSDRFDNIRLTHHAIFMVEYALTQTLIAEGIKPDMILGASLGEVTCAVISGCLSLQHVVEMLSDNGRIVSENCRPGGMLAVIHSPTLYHDLPVMYQNTELASINYASHFVISGDHHAITQVESALRSNTILCQRLAVNYGFHSMLMDKVEPLLTRHFELLPVKYPSIPWISCARAEVVPVFSGAHFWPAFRHPIYFQQTIHNMEQHGDYHYIDAGPTGTLSTFVKKNLDQTSKSTTSMVLTPYGLDLKMLKQLTALC